jgi:hypothetical protein
MVRNVLAARVLRGCANVLLGIVLTAQGQAMGAPGERVYITEAGGYRHARQHQSDLDARLSLHAA